MSISRRGRTGRSVMRSALLLALVPVLATACLRLESPLAVERAVLVLPTGGAPAAVYLTVHNRGRNVVSITGVELPGGPPTTLQSVTAHRMPAASAARGPMTLMSPIPSVDVEPGASVRFTPGGYTIAVASPTAPWQVGDSVAIAVVSAGAWRREGWAHVVTYVQLDSALGLDSAAGVPRDSAAQVALGFTLYRGNGCAQCHGVAGDGRGPLAATLAPPPRDFRRDQAFRNGREVDAIAQTLATGIQGGGAMPLYAHLTRSERLALAHYVRALLATPIGDAPAASPSREE